MKFLIEIPDKEYEKLKKLAKSERRMIKPQAEKIIIDKVNRIK